MQNMIKNLTGFFIRASFILAFEIPWLVHLGMPVGFSTFILPSFPVTLTHAPFDKSPVNHPLELGPLVTLIHLPWCCSAAKERPHGSFISNSSKSYQMISLEWMTLLVL
jgi:hypothetical protein